jgi:hypothetical protein
LSNPGAVLYLSGVRGTVSGGEAASFWLSVPRSGLVPVTASTRRIGAEQGLAIIAAEQEDEPVQVLP